LQNLPHVFFRDAPLEHALHGVNTIDDRAGVHGRIIGLIEPPTQDWMQTLRGATQVSPFFG